MTIKKAYDELEQEGYIISKQGKGTYVAKKNIELVREKAKRDIEEYIYKIIDLASKFDIEKKDIIDLFEYLYRSEEK